MGHGQEHGDGIAYIPHLGKTFFVNFEFHGTGTYTFADGIYWAGEWVEDYFSGEGGSYDPQGLCNEYGIWEKDVFKHKLVETKAFSYIEHHAPEFSDTKM